MVNPPYRTASQKIIKSGSFGIYNTPHDSTLKGKEFIVVEDAYSDNQDLVVSFDHYNPHSRERIMMKYVTFTKPIYEDPKDQSAY
jgi:hypothetical protein